jgi:hypothetical protein
MTRREDVRIREFHITDGRVTMDVGDTAADVRVGAVRHTPLSRGEAHATLRLTGEGFEASIDLDADDCAALAAALEAAPDEPDDSA